MKRWSISKTKGGRWRLTSPNGVTQTYLHTWNEAMTELEFRFAGEVYREYVRRVGGRYIVTPNTDLYVLLQIFQKHDITPIAPDFVGVHNLAINVRGRRDVYLQSLRSSRS